MKCQSNDAKERLLALDEVARRIIDTSRFKTLFAQTTGVTTTTGFAHFIGLIAGSG